MLLFRSEETVAEWCAAHELPVRPMITLDQLWVLATEWYSNRLTEESRRPGPAEMQEIFGRIGLTDPFWDPNTV
ncbi:MAG TPA: hypothetical protein VFH88_14175 [Candidatus Krumholzibacteria bacterium]|nr:hypothetical protein [Candidatus Krumholzibacteria bacterium]